MKGYRFKRLFDILLASIGVVVTFPLWALFSILIFSCDKGPIFYRQERVGRYGRRFQMLKFRSMDANSKTTLMGNFLRSTAMDELPQLLNILKGNMSFVGPRPIIPEELSPLGPEELRLKLSIRPGLTGMAQVYAGKKSAEKEKLRYGILYMKNQSLWLDIKLILLSLLISIKGRWEIKDRNKGSDLAKRTTLR